MKATLALANGTIFTGRSFGARGECCAELVFNTSMTGYQEILSDPSYKGQAVVLTAPMVGNYGTSARADEAVIPSVEALIVREATDHPAHYQSQETLSRYLERHGILGISGLDTRALTKLIRSEGLLHVCLATGDDVDPAALVEKARQYPGIDGCDTVQHVTTRRRHTFARPSLPEAPRVAVLDCGTKRNILKSLAMLGCGVEVYPASTPADVILKDRPDGVLISNGPGDPAGVPHIIRTVRELVGQVPLFGICLGHQILGLALGGTTYKLAFGHHGGNHPVRNLETGRIEITSQNHNYAVDVSALGDDLIVTHVNLFDGTLEGMRHRTLPVMSVQYHPEAAPGPHDSRYLFDTFFHMMRPSGRIYAHG